MSFTLSVFHIEAVLGSLFNSKWQYINIFQTMGSTQNLSLMWKHKCHSLSMFCKVSQFRHPVFKIQPQKLTKVYLIFFFFWCLLSFGPWLIPFKYLSLEITVFIKQQFINSVCFNVVESLLTKLTVTLKGEL